MKYLVIRTGSYYLVYSPYGMWEWTMNKSRGYQYRLTADTSISEEAFTNAAFYGGVVYLRLEDGTEVICDKRKYDRCVANLKKKAI